MTEKSPKAPFVYFGGKSNIASFVWLLLGSNIKRYFEPFAGSLAVLLARKRDKNIVYHDIVNDIDCLIINVWKVIKYSPDKLAKLCLDPVSHVLLWQRVCILYNSKDLLLKKMIKDDSYFDIKLAAYWLYVKATEIGVIDIDKLDCERIYSSVDNGLLVSRPQLIALNGIHSSCKQNGHNSKNKIDRLKSWFRELQSVLENTKIMCGDWKRLFSEKSTWQDNNGTRNVGIFFDPPYSDENRRSSLYRHDSFSVAKEVNDFCIKNANKKTYKIVIAGYEGEHNNLEKFGYTKYKWKAHGGYGNIGKSYKNGSKERLWASKSCNNIDLKGLTINEYMKIDKDKIKKVS